MERGRRRRLDRFALTAKDVISIFMADGEVLDLKLEEPDIERVVKNVYEGWLSLGGGTAGVGHSP
jgi:ABC-2 type transport system ATP-binding protein